jgi:hypothetical protein
MRRLFKGLAVTTFIAALVGTLVLSALLSHANAQAPTLAFEDNSNPLAQQIIGTWKLEEASTPGSPSGIGTRLKLFTGTHWCIIQPDPQSGLIVFQHGGRYTLDGDTMKTTRDFAGDSTRDMIGGTGSFKIKIDGDTMKQAHLEGVFNETWKRVK